MSNERTYPCLPCADIDEAIGFYGALGFKCTYRQTRPNPCAVVQREDFAVHLFGMKDFVAANSYGSVIVVVPDPDALYKAFAAGLRAAYGKLPVAGIPRVTRPRKKFGTVRGFSVVDVGGNWLRISKLGDAEPEPSEKATGLLGVLEVAVRLGDAQGTDASALRTLEGGLKRFPDAPAFDRAKALLYKVELAVRVRNVALARSALSEAKKLALSREEKKLLLHELSEASELVREAGDSGATEG